MQTIVLPSRCDRQAAISLLPEFRATSHTDELKIDASNVAQLGQAMLQLLLSAKRSHPTMTIIPSDSLRETARLTGLTTDLLSETVA